MTAALKAAYSLTELAGMAGLSRKQMRRKLENAQVRTYQSTERGKRWVVLASFAEAYPELWDSIILRAQFTDSVRT
jgi:hypothetical protein